MSNKYPKCECGKTRFDYFRKRYRNGTLHLVRQCPEFSKVAQNPMRQQEYDRNWVESLPTRKLMDACGVRDTKTTGSISDDAFDFVNLLGKMQDAGHIRLIESQGWIK